MSPTSYQAAPPRTTTIAEQPNSVKFVMVQPAFAVLKFPAIRLPRRVRSPIAPVLFAARMHVINPRAGLVRTQHHIPNVRDPIFPLAHGVNGNLAHVVR